MEIWNPINRVDNKFEISNTGLIRSNKGKILKLTINPTTGYLGVTVRPWGRSGKCILLRLHRELAIHFIPNPNNLPLINHKDGNKLNNSIDNLEWCDNKHNSQHARDMGLIKIYKGHEHVQSKLSKEDREYILKNYSRYDKNNTGRALATKFNVDKMQIYRIIKRGY